MNTTTMSADNELDSWSDLSGSESDDGYDLLATIIEQTIGDLKVIITDCESRLETTGSLTLTPIPNQPLIPLRRWEPKPILQTTLITTAGTPTPTPIPTPNSALKPTPKLTSNQTLVSTSTSTPTSTQKPTPTPTPTPTLLPKSTPTLLPKSTPTPLPKSTPTPLPKSTPTPLPKSTPTPLPKSTPTPTATPASNQTAKPTPRPPPKSTPTPTPNRTPKPISQSKSSSDLQKSNESFKCRENGTKRRQSTSEDKSGKGVESASSSPSYEIRKLTNGWLNPTLRPTRKPTSNPTPKPTSKPTQTPKPNPTPNQAPKAIPNRTPTPTLKPTPTPTPTPTPKSTSNRTLNSTPTPRLNHTSNSTQKPVSNGKPTQTPKLTSRPPPKSTPTPTPNRTPKPISQSKSSSNLQNVRQKSNESIKCREKGAKRRQSTSDDKSGERAESSWSGLSYELTKLLQKHTRRGDPRTDKTAIWDIKFKPSTKWDSGPQMVATCGGNIVNLIDLKTGTVSDHYEDDNFLETLNCMVWREFNVKTANNTTRLVNLICVGGTKKDNRLVNMTFINADNMKDYYKVGAHMGSINCLLFHPTDVNILYSAGYDRKVMVWHLKWDKLTTESNMSSIFVKKLHTIDCHNRALSMIYVPIAGALVVTGEDGLVFFMDPVIKEMNNGAVYNALLPDKPKMVDGLALVDEKLALIAFRYRDRILVADLERMIRSCGTANRSVVSGPTGVSLALITQLRYCGLKCDYFYMSVERRLLCCGTASGQVFIYYLKDSVLRPLGKENAVEPIRVLSLPALNRVSAAHDKELMIGSSAKEKFFVNTAAISPNHEYVVSGTNTNLVCIWKRATPTSLSSQSSQSSTHIHKKLKTVHAL